VLALMTLIKDGVASGSQFIIATHSPILMAQPDSEILLFEGNGIRTVPYDELEHVKLTRQFLADPARFLRHL
jgi:predicted ATPase